MSLQKELKEFAQGMSEQLPKEVLERVGIEIGKLSNSGILDSALKVGEEAPEFDLGDSKGNTVHLESLLEEGPLTIAFIRGNWCPFCNIAFKHLQNIKEELRKARRNIIIISPQLPEKSAQLIAENNYDFEMLYDKENKVAKRFGVAFKLSEGLKDLYQNVFEIPMVEFNGNEDWELPIPATFVIDKDKIITYASINPNWMERAEPSEYLDVN